MNIYIDKNNKGFCGGVKNAVRLATEQAEKCGGTVYTYGKLVHNAAVVESLESKGIKAIDNLELLREDDALVLRAHGATPEVYELCRIRGIKLVDATCPFVKKIARRAKEYYERGYKIVLFGDRTHPEIIGINGWCGNTAIISDGSEEIDLNCYEKALVMFQTTFDSAKVPACIQKLCADKVKMLEIFNTICYTTLWKQDFARLMSQKCDVVIVVGDKESSNTTKLLTIAQKSCAQTFLVCGANNLPKITNAQNVCLIAAASAPEELTEEVLTKMVEEANGTAVVTEVNTEFQQAVDKMPAKKSFRRDQQLRGIVVQKHEDGVSVTIPNSKGDGFIPNEELSVGGDHEQVKANLKIGDTVECIIISTEKRVTLSKKKFEEMYKDDALVEGIKAGEEFKLSSFKVFRNNLVGQLGSYRVKINASQIKIGYVKNLEQYADKELRLVALADGVDEETKTIHASQKELLLREKQLREDNFWNNIEINEIVEGKVLRFSPFGAFVSVRGFDCLAHISDLSWLPVKNPADVLALGKTYEFVVLKHDRAANRVSIGYKQLQPNPWTLLAEKYAPGKIVQGKVARILAFGAFVELEPGVDGLLHISNVSWDWLADINHAIKVGDTIDVAVLEFDPIGKRITLSRKATMDKPAEVVTRPAGVKISKRRDATAAPAAEAFQSAAEQQAEQQPEEAAPVAEIHEEN